MFYKKGVLRNFTKFTGKHLCQSLFFNKVAGLRPASLSKKRLWHRCFPVLCEISKNTVFTEHLQTTASVKCSLSKTKVKVAWTLSLHCRHSSICVRHLPLLLQLFLKYLKVHLKSKMTSKD